MRIHDRVRFFYAGPEGIDYIGIEIYKDVERSSCCTMIKKLVRQMLAAQVLSALTVSLCLLIDSIMIGRFLGVDAIAAYGLANPILLIIGAVGSMLSAGIQVVCSKSLGKGSQEETNKGYSSAIAVAVIVSVIFAVLVLLLRKPIATPVSYTHLTLPTMAVV